MVATVEETIDSDGRRALRLEGAFRLDGASDLREGVMRVLSHGPIDAIDLTDVERLEGAAASVLADAICSAGEIPEIVGASDDVRAILALYTVDGQCPARLPKPPRVGLFQQVGESTFDLLKTLRTMLTFVADEAGAAVAAIRSPHTIQWRAVGQQVERHGADGLPIVAVIGSLMGLITAFQAAIQLRKFGADAFVADLVSLSLTRELAPLMTAIVVAGRSGAAIAAEIGTMRVSEEVDALYTLGVCPHRYLVFPRIFALVIVLPLLTLVADIVGVLSGAVVATQTLDVSFRQFILSTQSTLDAADIMGGLLKAMVFGVFIAGIASERGLATRGGAEGVGRSTTSAVVSTLFWLVLVDTLFAVLFEIWNFY
ncbi:MAG: MlaE family lipid ABC transporter permease subunit [Planctomycetota bacterium]